jgi:hypothetical protein
LRAISGRNLATALLLILSLAFSTLAIQAVNFRTVVIGDGLGPSNPIIAQLLERSPQGEEAGSRQGNNQAVDRDNPAIQLVELTVLVFEEHSGTFELVPGAGVNVTVPRAYAEDVLGLGDVLAPEELGELPAGPIRIATGETDERGSILFELPPGNYSILVTHLGLMGNRSISLQLERPQVTMRWTFYSRFVEPLLVQAHDANGDSMISPGEQIILFYQTQEAVRPDQLTIIIRGETESQVLLQVLEFRVLSHGVELILTPLTPMIVSELSEQSVLLVGVLWYQVAIFP